MLPDELEKRLDGIEDASKKGYPVRNLYKIACEPGLWLQAYVNIRANAGALTQGVSTDTIDGFSIERAEKLAKTLRSREYVAKPVRRVQIPKKDGKTRPLGIPGGDDKLAQEVARIILKGFMNQYSLNTLMDSDQNVRVKLRSDLFVQSGTELNGSWMLISKVSLTISPTNYC